MKMFFIDSDWQICESLGDAMKKLGHTLAVASPDLRVFAEYRRYLRRGGMPLVILGDEDRFHEQPLLCAPGLREVEAGVLSRFVIYRLFRREEDHYREQATTGGVSHCPWVLKDGDCRAEAAEIIAHFRAKRRPSQPS